MARFGTPVSDFRIPRVNCNDKSTIASLADFLDRKVLVVMSGSKTLTGVLRAFDQFSNIILEDTYERVYGVDPASFAPKQGSTNTFADPSTAPDAVPSVPFEEIPLGLYLLRGDNIELLGCLDPERDEALRAAASPPAADNEEPEGTEADAAAPVQ
eukprot:TRINITY_DN70351_c0_g1_i1.p2 TRINITY_DN70351_c0_g1~~TRINITY_DN70351_c0_g1_i1.p2  ORF type:complete len:156 (+),score=21.50 TRINITY_DN70351_c0_g1_i1:114-581(+)